MIRNKKIIIVLFVIVILLSSVWLLLDSHTKCKLIYGKNICNFYEMMNTVSHNPESSDFEKAMESVRASITPNIIKFYQKISETLGSGIAKKDKSDKDIQYM